MVVIRALLHCHWLKLSKTTHEFIEKAALMGRLFALKGVASEGYNPKGFSEATFNQGTVDIARQL